jgi:hypothetical protein
MSETTMEKGTAMLGVNGDWSEIPLSEALEKVSACELYECDLCELSGNYDDGLRTFHPCVSPLMSSLTASRNRL